MPVDVILDCDTGTDDAVAIMLAALSPQIRLTAVTTVCGNVPLSYVTENTLRVLAWIGKATIPVYAGASHPLDRDDFPVPRDRLTGFEMHGTYLELPASGLSAADISATDYLLGQAAAHHQSGDDLTIIATGPLTNIATCVRADPAFAGRVNRLIVMGGGHAIGNVTPSAEFNFWADPEAANVVMNAGFPDLTLIPLDATHEALVSLSDCEALRAVGTPAALATAQVIEQRIHAHDASQPMDTAGTAPVHDAVCVATLIDPHIVTTHLLHVDVETGGDLTLGRSVIDVHHRSRQEANAQVALSADPRRFVNLMLQTFANN